MKITKNFSLKELTFSSTAERAGLENLPSDEQLVATVTQGTATAGTFTVLVEHG